MLLSRKDFRTAVFERDVRCVLCKGERQDAHHLIDRRLWPDGGYYLDNGVTLCGICHLEAERTILDPEVLRKQAGIKTILLPPSFDEECEYDKWGNPVWPDLTRSKGPLFNDLSVQRALKAGGVLDRFTSYQKHARTPHLPWSPNAGKDGDKTKDVFGELKELYLNIGDVVVTQKLDGEQTTMYPDHYHARSIDSGYHPARTWVGNLHGQIKHEIPEGFRIVGENLYATHSIAYHDLPSYFFVFAIFDGDNYCLSWTDTEAYAEMLGLLTVPSLYRGPYDQKLFESPEFFAPTPWGEVEGYVVRSAVPFPYSAWDRRVGKVVRKDHVKTDQHWRHRAIKTNDLA